MIVELIPVNICTNTSFIYEEQYKKQIQLIKSVTVTYQGIPNIAVVIKSSH